MSDVSVKGSSKPEPPTPLLYYQYVPKKEAVSPFLKPSSVCWSAQLRLRAACVAALLLLVSYALRWTPSTLPIAYLLLLQIYFLTGAPSLIEAIYNVADLNINIDVLMNVAAFSAAWLGSSFEGALLLVLFELSGAMEETVTFKARDAINALHRLAPPSATVVKADGVLLERSVKDIKVDTVILVRSGQVVPLDGVVISGESSVNLSHLTGEPMPVVCHEGDEVPAGAANLEGALTLRVTRTNTDSTVTRILQLVIRAQEARPQLQQWFDRVSRTYSISIISFSGLIALTLPWLQSMDYLGRSGSIYRALTFLIAASPCALIIAIPTAYLSAVSACARKGILLKGGITLDALSKCSVIAFDKTGTLTTGELKVTSYESLGEELTNHRLSLSVAAALERNAVHPIARAITAYAEEAQVDPAKLAAFKATPGRGLEGTVSLPQGDLAVRIGRPESLLSEVPSELREPLGQRIERAKQRGELVALLVMGRSATLFTLRDTLRPAIEHTLRQLEEEGSWRLVMLTGDHPESARAIAKELELKEVYADLKPEDKLRHVSRLAREKGLVMVGDGVNDAPALARASVGICMGKVGSSTAIEAADIVLLQDNLERLPWLMRRSRLTQRVVRENLAVAGAAIIVATAPALLGLVPLWLAVVLHEGGTLLVGLNALRLLKT